MELLDAGAIVFGGASGLGEATAIRLASAGAMVVIADIDADRGRDLAARVDGSFVACDVRQPDQVKQAVDSGRSADRGLRISVCCAGIGPPTKIVGRDGPAPLQHYEQVISINLLGTINVTRLVAAAMIENQPEDLGERGVCINTASIAAYEGQIGQTAYAASKGGIVSFTLPAARDLAQHGVRVVTIAPGLFDTPMMASLPEPARKALGSSIPFPSELGSPVRYAQLVQSIIENPMLNGEVIRLDGALRMAPR
jgi:NAD(P)-dependent dehydrogenase (short-subunit alcohol dehydrogenase family)